MQKYNKFKKQYAKDQQTSNSFDNLYRNRLQNNLVDESEYEPLWNFFIKYVDEKKKIFFININSNSNI